VVPLDPFPHEGRVCEQVEVRYETEVVERGPGDLVTVGVGLEGEEVLGDGAVACLPSVRKAANGGEQFVDGGTQPLRHLVEEVVGETGVGVTERDLLEGGDAERILGTHPDHGRHENQQRALQGTFALAAVAELDQLGAGYPDIVQRPIRR
jgi:hypothetical protein